MKKPLVLPALLIAALLLTGLLLLHSTSADLSSWLGNYFYFESFLHIEPDHPAMSIEYNIYIKEDDGGLYAEIDDRGWQTRHHIRAKIVGDERGIDLLFEDYLEEHGWGEFQEGELLISLKLDPETNQLYTTWHGMTSETAYINEQMTGIYYERNYKIFDISKSDSVMYRYEIYDNYGNTVKSETVHRIAPKITYLESSLIAIETSAGTGLFLAQYYDTEDGIFSDVFESPKMAQNGKLVYMTLADDTVKLVVRDIFDKTRYYKEYALDFSPVADPSDALLEAEFIEDAFLKIVYLSGASYEEKSTVLSLD